MSKGFKVTVEDLDTGDSRSMIVGAGDYMLIPFAPCYLANAQRYPKSGTTMLTLKDHRPQPIEPSGVSQEGGNP